MRRSDIPVLAFNVGYLVLASFFALSGQNFEFVFYIVVMVVLMTAVGLLHARVRLPAAALWALSAWGVLHMAGGLIPVGDAVLYNFWLVPGWLKYDQLTHAYGFGVATWILWLCLQPQLRDPRPRAGVLSICAFGGMGLGAFNEVVEFIATRIAPETNVGGYENTALDLLFNLFGATLAVVLIGMLSSKFKVQSSKL